MKIQINHILLKSAFLSWMLLSSIVCTGQNYVMLADASGFDRSGYEAEFIEATEELKTTVEEINLFYNQDILDFNLFDFGFYLFNPLYESGVESALDIGTQLASSTSEQYILLAKESNSQKIYSKLHFIANLPEGHNCYTNARFVTSIQEYIDYQDYNSSPYSVLDFQVGLIKLIANQLDILFICCDPNVDNLNYSRQKKRLNITTCDGVDYLEEHKLGIAKDYILNFLSCSGGTSGIVKSVFPTDPLYVSINKLNSSTSIPGCSVSEGIVDCYKTDPSPNPSMYSITAPEFPLEKETISTCQGSTGSKLLHIEKYDFGAFIIHTTSGFDLYSALADKLETTSLDELREVIIKVASSNRLNLSEKRILANGIGCQLDNLEFEYQYLLLSGLLDIDDKSGLFAIVGEYVSSVVNGDYSSLLFYVLSSIEHDDALFKNLKNDPSTISKLISYNIDSDYEVDLKLLLLEKYKNVITESTILHDEMAVVIPFEVNKVLQVFKEQNFTFNNNPVKYNIDVTDLSTQSTYTSCGAPIKVTWESKYPKNFNYLRPLILPQLQVADENINYQNYLVPAFLLPSITSDIQNDNYREALLLTADVVSLAFGGAGVYKIIASNLIRAKKIQFAIAGTQTILGATNTVLRLSEDCQSDADCRKYSDYLTILELVTLSPDFYQIAKGALFKSVDDIVESVNDVNKVRVVTAAQDLEYLQRRVKRITQLDGIPTHLDDFVKQCNLDIRILNELSDVALNRVAKELQPKDLANFVSDLNASKRKVTPNGDGQIIGDMVHFLNQNSDGVKAWEVLDDVPGTSSVFRSKIDNLEAVDGFFAKYPSRIDEFKSVLNDPSLYSDLLGKEAFLNSVKIFDDIPSINNSSQLIEVLSNVREVHRVTDLESKGVNKFFRGINLDANGVPYQGNPNTLANGTSTSSDPIVATIFGVQARTVHGGPGKLLLFEPSNLGSMKLEPPNLRVELEREIIMDVTPTNLYGMKEIEIDVDDARSIIQQITGHPLDSSIPSGADFQALQEALRMTTAQIDQFYQMALDL